MTLDLDLDKPLRELKQDLERIYFAHHLKRLNWNVLHVAVFVGVDRSHTYRKMKELGITRRNST